VISRVPERLTGNPELTLCGSILPNCRPYRHCDTQARVGLRNWRELLFAMFTCYFDCSQSGHQGGTVAVSGWLSTGERWLEFDEE
jgi:hypothetical protein